MKKNTDIYYEEILNEIFKLLKDNTNAYFDYDKEMFPYIRDYCEKHLNEKYEKLSYSKLIFFAEEVLTNLINCPFLYDFRELE